MSRRERTMLMALGGIAVVAVAFFLLTRGGGAPPEDTNTLPSPGGVPTAQPSVSPLPKLPPLAIFGGRDPFFPLFFPEGAATGSPSPQPSGSPGPSVSPPPSPGGGGTNVGDHDVRVLDVFIRDGEEFVQVEVDGTVFTVQVGDTFAGNFRVVSIDGHCATFLFGDEQFTECEPGFNK
jgi:hypothetical protein